MCSLNSTHQPTCSLCLNAALPRPAESAEETSDIRAMVVGYSLLLSMGFWGCMMCCAICYTMRTLFCVQSAPAVCQLILRPLSRRIAASLHYAATVVKVMILLLVELGLFPAVCGVWLDICTLSLVRSPLSRGRQPWIRLAAHGGSVDEDSRILTTSYPPSPPITFDPDYLTSAEHSSGTSGFADHRLRREARELSRYAEGSCAV